MRKIRGLTQEQLAEQVGVDVRTISRIETGETATEFANIERVANILGVEPFHLFIPQKAEPTPDLIKTRQIFDKVYNEVLSQENRSPKNLRGKKHESLALSRFDQNRNRTPDQLAPIRVKTLAKAYQELIGLLPNVDKGTIWANLQRVYGEFLTGLTSELINDTVSAHQSWVKTSGTAFEHFILATLNNSMENISVMRPGEIKLYNMVNADKLVGKSEDDLLIVSHDTLVGVIQAKTSVRERMKTDASHSQLMLKAGLWSIHITIDPDNFLRNPKFRDLADGTSELGHVWHGVYKLSSLVSESTGVYDFGRIFNHFPQAVHAVLEGKMTENWKPS